MEPLLNGVRNLLVAGSMALLASCGAGGGGNDAVSDSFLDEADVQFAVVGPFPPGEGVRVESALSCVVGTGPQPFPGGLPATSQIWAISSEDLQRIAPPSQAPISSRTGSGVSIGTATEQVYSAGVEAGGGVLHLGATTKSGFGLDAGYTADGKIQWLDVGSYSTAGGERMRCVANDETAIVATLDCVARDALGAQTGAFRNRFWLAEDRIFSAAASPHAGASAPYGGLLIGNSVSSVSRTIVTRNDQFTSVELISVFSGQETRQLWVVDEQANKVVRYYRTFDAQTSTDCR